MSLAVTLFLIIAIVLLLMGVNVAVALGASSIIYFILAKIPLMSVVQILFSGCDVVVLLCIPFFILAGDLMAKGGIAKRIVAVCNMIVGSVHGGLACVTMLVCALFAAMTGSAMACCITIGSIMLPYMLQAGYDKDFSTGIFCSGAVLGPIIPPSTAMVVYAVSANVNLAKLYLLGVPAGIFLMLALCIVAYFMCRKKGYRGASRSVMITGNENEKLTFKMVASAVLKAIPALGSPVIILGAIYTGIATPTEAAVVAVIYSFLVGKFVYRELKFKDIPKMLKTSAIGTAKVMFIVATANLFSWVLTRAQLPQMVVNGLMSISDNKFVILTFCIVILLIMGCFMDATPIMLITIPMFTPIINQIGYDPLYFGLIMSIAVCIGFVTPPFGTVLFTGMSVSGATMKGIVKNLWPFIIVMLVLLFLFAFVPGIITWIIP